MKILLTSDTHLGITKSKAIEKMLKEAVLEKPDIIIHAGDYSGGTEGNKKVTSTVKLIRKYFPTTTFLSVNGNHDYWVRGKKIKGSDSMFYGPSYQKPSLHQYITNLEKIKATFKEHNVHFLDYDGPYRCDWLYPEVIIMGVSGWYKNPNPPTNDQNFLPIGLNGDTNRYLLKEATRLLDEQAEAVRNWYTKETQVIFVSHFPVVPAGNDYKGGFEDFSWDSNIYIWLEEEFGCKMFLNGHAHMFHKGPKRWEAGSDYYLPKYQIIEV